MTSPTNFETNTSSLLDGSESTLPTQRICDLNEGKYSVVPVVHVYFPYNFRNYILVIYILFYLLLLQRMNS